jgi:hypothetical protein
VLYFCQHTKGVQWSSEEALRRQREDFERIRLSLEHALEEKEDELQRQCSQADGAVQDVLRGRDAADDLLRQECRSATAAAAQAAMRQQAAERQATELRARLADVESRCRTFEAQCGAISRQADGAKTDHAVALAELQARLDVGDAAREEAAGEHHADVAELLLKLQEAEMLAKAADEELAVQRRQAATSLERLEESLEANFQRSCAEVHHLPSSRKKPG